MKFKKLIANFMTLAALLTVLPVAHAGRVGHNKYPILIEYWNKQPRRNVKNKKDFEKLTAKIAKNECDAMVQSLADEMVRFEVETKLTEKNVVSKLTSGINRFLFERIIEMPHDVNPDINPVDVLNFFIPCLKEENNSTFTEWIENDTYFEFSMINVIRNTINALVAVRRIYTIDFDSTKYCNNVNLKQAFKYLCEGIILEMFDLCYYNDLRHRNAYLHLVRSSFDVYIDDKITENRKQVVAIMAETLAYNMHIIHNINGAFNLYNDDGILTN